MPPKSLQQMMTEALDNNPNEDACKDQVIKLISDYSIDFAIGTYLRANSKDEKFNELVDALSVSYYNLIRYLEKEGRIRINGVQVSKQLNK